MTTTSVAATEEKSATDMIGEMEDYSRRFRAMRTKNPTRMMSLSDMVSYNETMTETLKAMMNTLFAYMDFGIKSLQDSGIGTEAVRPFITLTEQVLFAQSRLMVMICKAAGFLDENGLTEKMPQGVRTAFDECDARVRDWAVKRDSFLEHLSKIEAERAADDDDDDDNGDDDDDDNDGDDDEGDDADGDADGDAADESTPSTSVDTTHARTDTEGT